MAETLERVRAHRRARELSGDSRAGSWSAGEARRLQRDFLRRDGWRYAAVTAIGVAVTPLVLLFPTWTRGIAAGAWLSSLGWLMVLWTVLASGAGSRLMGEAGEQWSAQELRSLRKQG